MTVAPDAAELVPAYARAGLPVLPLHVMRRGVCTCGRPAGSRPDDCHSPAKHPLTRHGKDDATTDLGVIAEWFARWPGCNWGIRPPVGVVVLDVDPRNGGGTGIAELQAQHEALPATLSARTGSGGVHIWLSYHGPTRGRLCRGVDVKSNSGYLVAPPSVHASGGTYEWINQSPAAYAPQWVKDILNPPIRRRPPNAQRGAGRIDPLILFVADSQEGERNNRLFWAACRARDGGLDPEPLVEAAVGIGLSQLDAAATVRSAEHAAPRNARTGG